MYSIIIENVRTREIATLLIHSPVDVGTVIGWGSDPEAEDGIARWTVTYLAAPKKSAWA